MFWFDDGQPVNQVLGSELPAQPLDPPYSANDAGPFGASADEPGSSADAQAAESATSPGAVWAGLAAALLAALAGSALYLRTRARRSLTAS
ncbi:hypothetical protein EUA93_04655 [Nocardioides oleivorans]|uniref:LPXTG cell wall anchor domain-containing protein n=1 Tax=Nocardioides oleivorans TaxID=273676 RepID=A0A4Q2RXF6_9ACTN|nr:hypothetical protein [Nocardioides oleivorans]RYB93708.1 hypothetical protein EUA93_04655 [Nocardioides oleivorans]